MIARRIQGIIVFIAGGAAACLLFARFLVTAEWQQPINFAILAVVVGMLVALAIVNKITRGEFFSKPTSEAAERLRVQSAARELKFKMFLYIFASFMLSIPFLAVLRHYGWSFNQALIAPALICAALYWGIRRIKAARANRSV
jgi:hypothetical protein